MTGTPDFTIDPLPVPLPADEYEAAYEDWKGQWPDWSGPWYDKMLGRLPRAYVERREGHEYESDGRLYTVPEDGAIVYDTSRFDDWWEVFVFEAIYWVTFTLTVGQAPFRLGLRGLIPHEFSHLAGFSHPPKTSYRYWLDVVGGVGPRCLDKHGIIEASEEWRESHGL